MKTSPAQKIVLAATGITGIAIGAGILFIPKAFHATSGIEVGNDINLLNEMRAAGGVILAASLFVLSGAFVQRLALAATMVGFGLSFSYALSRFVSMWLDGLPGLPLLQVTALELVISLACGLVLLRSSRHNAFRVA